MAALSARGLAASASAAGYAVLAVDRFGDLDLQATCARSIRIGGDPAAGLPRRSLITALRAVSADRHPIGLLTGAGFEDRPSILGDLARRWPLLGNDCDAVRRVKDPGRLAGLCSRLGIPHPRWSDTDEGEGWLVKRQGGSGGTHVRRGGRRPAAAGSGAMASDAGRYWQERVAGTPVSALVLGNGAAAKTLGFSAQWPDPCLDAPFRYGGAVRPAGLPPGIQAALGAAAEAIVGAARLIGLNSVDFLVAGARWHLIEINPRPGATMDLYAPEAGSLAALHIAACGGDLPARAPEFKEAAAAAVVYARRAVASIPVIAWPDWTADRQRSGTRVEAGEPLCTVLAQSETPDAARQLIGARARAVRSLLGAH